MRERVWVWERHNTLFISDVKDARDEKKFGVLLGGKDAILNGPVRRFPSSLPHQPLLHPGLLPYFSISPHTDLVFWVCVCVCGVQRVNDYLVEHNVKGVMYDPQAEHGAVLFGKAKMALVVDWVRRGEREGEEYAD